MTPFTLHDLQCFDAVVNAGGFQAAADALHRSHPAVYAAVAKLERQLGLALLDRTGYRVRPTPAGQAFQRRAQRLLRELQALRHYADQLSMGEESELRVVVGDLCPRPATLALLGRFFSDAPVTRLDLLYEAVSGPAERLHDGDADLILHRVDKSDPRLEWIDLCKVPFVPVAAPDFLPVPPGSDLSPERLRELTQCVIRDTARHSPAADYFIIDGAHQCTVPDQNMKKEIILQGMAWGHLPKFLIDRELARSQLLALTNRHLPGRTEDLVAARRRDRAHGPVANRLWEYLRKQAAAFRTAVRPAGPARAACKR